MKKILEKIKQESTINQLLNSESKNNRIEISIPDERELEEFKILFLLACW